MLPEDLKPNNKSVAIIGQAREKLEIEEPTGNRLKPKVEREELGLVWKSLAAS